MPTALGTGGERGSSLTRRSRPWYSLALSAGIVQAGKFCPDVLETQS